MDVNDLLDTIGFAGKLLIESGAEIYRVEETMIRLSKSFQEVEHAESFVTPTGIMFSITVAKTTQTKVLRVHSRGVNLNCIDRINDLSRQASIQQYTIADLAAQLHEIANEKRYSFPVTLIFSALSAGGFAFFFGGNLIESVFAFFIGIAIKCISYLFEKKEWNQFFTNAVAAGAAAMLAILCTHLAKIDMDIVIISSIMLLVPGLAITNAIRDTMAGDYLSGVARGMEAFLVAIAIASSIGFVLSMFMGMQGG